MLAFKFFVFVGIIVNLFNSFKKVKEENSTKNKLSVVIAIGLFVFGIYMLWDAFL